MTLASSPAERAPPRILLAEDSQAVAIAVSRYLRDEYEVLHAPDGTEAWTLLCTDPAIEVVITDVRLPHLDGHELLERIRASERPRLRNLPVIVMTAAENSADRQRAFTSGASDFIGRPPDPIELQARVRVHQRLAHTIRELESNRAILEEQASTDPLTRLKNRRAFHEFGRRYFALAQRYRNDLAMVMLDIDHFKAINDAYGHAAGDQVLMRIAQALERGRRAGDTAARLGGEEFALLLPNTDRAGAALVAERIRIEVENGPYVIGGRALVVTTSAGVAAYEADEPQSLAQLVETADKRLYLAKQAGRNRVIAAD